MPKASSDRSSVKTPKVLWYREHQHTLLDQKWTMPLNTRYPFSLVIFVFVCLFCFIFVSFLFVFKKHIEFRIYWFVFSAFNFVTVKVMSMSLVVWVFVFVSVEFAYFSHRVRFQRPFRCPFDTSLVREHAAQKCLHPSFVFCKQLHQCGYS